MTYLIGAVEALVQSIVLGKKKGLVLEARVLRLALWQRSCLDGSPGASEIFSIVASFNLVASEPGVKASVGGLKVSSEAGGVFPAASACQKVVRVVNK